MSCLGLPFIRSAYSSDQQSPRTLALGGAGHAGPLLNDPLYLNPAFISLNQAYAMSFSYLKYADGDFKGRNYNLSLQDGRTELFQAGVGYTLREEGSLITVAGSKQVADRMAVGTGVKLHFGNDHTSAKDLFLAYGAVATDWLQLSFLADNLLSSSSGKSRGFIREFVIGSKFNLMNIVLVYADPHFAPSLSGSSALGHEVGLEFTLMKDLFLRLGQFRNSNIPHQSGKRGNGYSIGAGWVGPRISFDYAYSKINDDRGGLRKTRTHTLGLTAFF